MPNPMAHPDGPDDEVRAIMDELNGLQSWCVLMSRKDSGGLPAADLIQRTRILIIERLYPSRTLSLEASNGAS